MSIAQGGFHLDLSKSQLDNHYASVFGRPLPAGHSSKVLPAALDVNCSCYGVSSRSVFLLSMDGVCANNKSMFFSSYDSEELLVGTWRLSLLPLP